MTRLEDFETLRQALIALGATLVHDHPAGGLLAEIPVAGGSLVHPVTREAIAELGLYGAGPDSVKIFVPRILGCLPPLSIAGLSDCTQLCGGIAHRLGLRLAELGSIRQNLASLGLQAELEPHILRLRVLTHVGDRAVELSAWQPAELIVTALDGRRLTDLPRDQRTVRLTGTSAEDLHRLAHAVEALAGQALTQAKAQAFGGFGEAESATPAPAAGGPRVASTPGLSVKLLFDKLGLATEITAHEGRIRLRVPLKVVQGEFTFYLEQTAGTVFRGMLVSPSGNRHRVDLDLGRIFDIKDVFDQIMLSS